MEKRCTLWKRELGVRTLAMAAEMPLTEVLDLEWVLRDFSQSWHASQVPWGISASDTGEEHCQWLGILDPVMPFLLWNLIIAICSLDPLRDGLPSFPMQNSCYVDLRLFSSSLKNKALGRKTSVPHAAVNSTSCQIFSQDKRVPQGCSNAKYQSNRNSL